MRVDAVEHEREHARLARARCRSGARPGIAASCVGRVARAARARARAIASRPSALEVVDRGAEADRAGDVRRAGLELVRRARCTSSSRSVTERIMSPPPWYGGIASSSSAPAVEHADAGRAEHLVAGEGVEVAVERPHVDRAGAAPPARRRRSTGDAARVRELRRSRATGIDRAERVRDVGERDQPRARSEQLRRTRRSRSSPRVVDRRPRAAARRVCVAERSATARCSSGAPCSVIEDLVARRRAWRAPHAVGDEVDRLGGAAHEDDLARARRR